MGETLLNAIKQIEDKLIKSIDKTLTSLECCLNESQTSNTDSKKIVKAVKNLEDKTKEFREKVNLGHNSD